MNPAFRTTILAAVLVALSPTAYAQDFAKGLEFVSIGNYEAALKEWRPLAEQGDAEAQHHLGALYSMGAGVLKDSKEAYRWFRLAADQGYSKAQTILGVLHADGHGAPKDVVAAHKWFTIATANGSEEAGQYRSFLETTMTPEQIAQATQKAKTCLSSNYANCD